MVRAFIWKRAGVNVNLKTLNDLLNVLTNAIDDELIANLFDNKRFLIKWLEESYPGKGGLIFVLKDSILNDTSTNILDGLHKLRDVLIEHLRLLMEK